MVFFFIEKVITQRKGVSQVIGTLFMLAIVAAVGSIILVQGIQGINDFNNSIALFSGAKHESLRESLIIEHVRFDPTSTDKYVHLTVRNTGKVDVVIDTVTIVKIDTQELVVSNRTSSQTILIDDSTTIRHKATLSLATIWNDPDYTNSQYRISITTSTGKLFETIAKPFNT